MNPGPNTACTTFAFLMKGHTEGFAPDVTFNCRVLTLAGISTITTFMHLESIVIAMIVIFGSTTLVHRITLEASRHLSLHVQGVRPAAVQPVEHRLRRAPISPCRIPIQLHQKTMVAWKLHSNQRVAW